MSELRRWRDLGAAVAGRGGEVVERTIELGLLEPFPGMPGASAANAGRSPFGRHVALFPTPPS